MQQLFAKNSVEALVLAPEADSDSDDEPDRFDQDGDVIADSDSDIED
jgi:hypothetical protein